MTITSDQILRVRRMINEPTTTTYSDVLITAMAEDHAHEQSNWPDADTVVYDLHAISADIWEEKAAALASDYDFQADGASYSRSKAYEQALKQVEYHRSRRKVHSRRQVKWPREAQVDVTL